MFTEHSKLGKMGTNQKHEISKTVEFESPMVMKTRHIENDIFSTRTRHISGNTIFLGHNQNMEAMKTQVSHLIPNN